MAFEWCVGIAASCEEFWKRQTPSIPTTVLCLSKASKDWYLVVSRIVSPLVRRVLGTRKSSHAIKSEPHRVFSTILMSSFSRRLRIGSQTSMEYGARTPGLLKAGWPSRSSWVAMPQVTPTDEDIAEWPLGSPRSSSVEVDVSYAHKLVKRLA